ncbi:hypothetical protein GIB67_009959 [Kingdonia uniflora]|uniref:NB-ARC domain-containing protein n=1 Tax=Kingdonia uniflora TaxID=39325 RepID=A0A7J7L901_9MAGN|nr:hypothetical protein GIB67_009959 [Kingdonia uniflora]
MVDHLRRNKGGITSITCEGRIAFETEGVDLILEKGVDITSEILSNGIDLLNPRAELEKRNHKLKRLVQSPNSFYMIQSSKVANQSSEHELTNTNPKYCLQLKLEKHVRKYIQNGLKTVIKLGSKKVMLGSDSKAAISIVQLIEDPTWDARDTLQSILKSIAQFGQFIIFLKYKEANMLFDYLAKVLNAAAGYIELNYGDSSIELKKIVNEDADEKVENSEIVKTLFGIDLVSKVLDSSVCSLFLEERIESKDYNFAVAMGGSGRSTRANKVYSVDAVKNHFQTCAWINVSQDYEVKVLLGIAKEDLKAALPDMNNGSRIIITAHSKEAALQVDIRTTSRSDKSAT